MFFERIKLLSKKVRKVELMCFEQNTTFWFKTICTPLDEGKMKLILM